MTKAGVAAVAGALVALTACSSATHADPSQPLVAFDDSWGQIFVANLDGSGLRQITPTAADQPDGSWTSAPALSADGRRLAYTSGSGSIDVLDLEFDAVRRFTRTARSPSSRRTVRRSRSPLAGEST